MIALTDFLKCPDPLEIKDDSCYKHKKTINFTNKLFKVPSGKTIWTGCPKCKEIQNALDATKGMEYDKETKQWFKSINQSTPKDPYSDFRTKGFKD